MQQIFEDYGDVAEIRLVYINEAHAADSSWPARYAKEKNITKHDNYGERCQSAELLLNDKNLTIPFVIDEMNNHVNEAYSAWPDRVFLVRTDGRLAVAGTRGPFGFVPALKEVKKWLAVYKETGVEPDLPDDAADAGEDLDVATIALRKEKAASSPKPESKPDTETKEDDKP